MQRKWPFITVASLLNALLITGVFISLYPRGFTIAELYTITPLLFATTMFVLTFVVIIAGIGIRQLISGIINRLKGTRVATGGYSQKSLSGFSSVH